MKSTVLLIAWLHENGSRSQTAAVRCEATSGWSFLDSNIPRQEPFAAYKSFQERTVHHSVYVDEEAREDWLFVANLRINLCAAV